MRNLSKLKITILKEGVTQKKLARRTDLDASVVSLICNGRYVQLLPNGRELHRR
jgi:transcriptional regulator with XRE-family HTH domain